MPKEREKESFASLGDDIKAARQVLNISRRELAKMANIDPRYLANIENSGSLPVFYQLVKICKLPVERYFFPEAGEQDDPERQRTAHKLSLCPKQYLLVIEGTIDGAIGIEEAEDA